jgi:choline dehydrogenase-like flavoprotein
LFQRFERDGTQVRVALRPSDAAQRRERILNSSADVTPIEDRYTGYDAFREVASALRRGRRPPDFARHLREMILDFDETAGGLYGRLRGRDYSRPPEIMLHARSEQAPNRFSRVMLGSGRDALGLPTVRLQWQLSDLDKVTIRHTNRLIGEEFGRLGLGRVRLDKWLLADDTTWPGAAEATAPWEPLRGGCHHMGTTRMAGDPRHGVVGADCRVHELENLYVAGSSVFPTCGFMNPTLTIVALALRLSEHLGAPPPSRPDQPGPDRDPSRSR